MEASGRDWRLQERTGGYRTIESVKTRLEVPKYDWGLQDTTGDYSRILLKATGHY